MANHKSALKRIRSNDKKRLRNRFQHKTTRGMDQASSSPRELPKITPNHAFRYLVTIENQSKDVVHTFDYLC